MRTRLIAISLIFLMLGIGCTRSNKQEELSELKQATGDNTMKSETQILSSGGSKFCEITANGEVWINGDKQGSIEANGEIWVAGDKEGSLEANGEVWKAGNKIGDVTSDLEVWFEGDNVGEIEADGTVWRSGETVGSTQGGNPRRAAIVFFFGFFS